MSEALRLGALRDDLRYDFARGFLKVGSGASSKRARPSSNERGTVQGPRCKIAKAKQKEDVAKKEELYKPFRTLVVVPRSHSDGTYTRLMKIAKDRRFFNKNAAKQFRVGKLVSDRCSGRDLCHRARALDLRPDAEKGQSCTSLWVVWDSRLVHQGHTVESADWDPLGLSGEGKRPKDFKPTIFGTKRFSISDRNGWTQHLRNEGFAVIRNPLSNAEVTEATKYLLGDIQDFCSRKGIKPPQSLAKVADNHLPNSGQGNVELRTYGGIAHGRFAWFLRTRPVVAKLFAQLFTPGSKIAGSVDALALSPPNVPPEPRPEWLHLDYTPEGRSHSVYQSTLYVFPKSQAMGANWRRMGISICMAPSVKRTPEAEASLLWYCVNGHASRATAGVLLGLSHTKRVPQGGTLTQIVPPKLNPRLTEEGFQKLVGSETIDNIKDVLARKLGRRANKLLPYLYLLSSKEALSVGIDAEAITSVLPAEKVRYICGTVPRPSAKKRRLC